MRPIIFAVLLLFFSLHVCSQRTVAAVKATAPPRIDGNLSDPAWASATLLTGLTQNFPRFGEPASTRTEVRILYDDEAIYIGAYLYDDPAAIRRQLTSRDGEQRQDVDYCSIFFDTYNDQQNGFQFLVTSANVQSDARLGGNNSGSFGDFGDKTWDAVWQSKTAFTAQGWIAEIRIPYISLRFTQKEIQTWGLQFLRFTRRNNESAYWNPVSPNINGFVNQFGKLTGLEDIRPPLRLSFSPYLSAGLRLNPPGYRNRNEFLRSGGMDVKWGLNESFTLDATLVPDFGQVISDNVVNNLTPYEIRFQENRPFFTEGTELFNKAGLFYSRRVGARPAGYGRIEQLYGSGNAAYEIIDNPAVTQLYNAVKLSGRTPKNLGVGIFNALTAPVTAQIRNRSSGKDSVLQTEPLSNYNLFVLDQAFKGRSSVTFTNANVTRNGAARDANVSALDWSLFTINNKYAVSGTVRYSSIFGYTPYSSAYFMNLDTVTINGRRFLKPYDGYNTRFRFAKVGGRLRYHASVNVESDKFDPNDLGYLQAPNEVLYTTGISYNEFSPSKRFINYSYSFNTYYISLYRPSAFSQVEMTLEGNWLFHNFWDVQLMIGGQPVAQVDYFELQQAGMKVKKPAFGYANISGSTDSRKKLFLSYTFGYEHSTLKNSPYFLVELGARYRFSNKLTMSLNTARQSDRLQVGNAYVPGMKLIGYRENKDLTPILSGTYNFTSRMNLTLRARHYWNRVHYKSFYSVNDKGDHIPHAFIDSMDQNINAFNLDAFYTWDFKPGCRIIVGWKNALGDGSAIDRYRYTHYFNNLGRSFGLAHSNEFTFRLIYFIDYNQFRVSRKRAASINRDEGAIRDRENAVTFRRSYVR